MSDTVETLRQQIADLRAELDGRRMCVTCGQFAPAGVDRHYENPACSGPDGTNPCLFDMTPHEAWQHWRMEAHDAFERIRQLEKTAVSEKYSSPAKACLEERAMGNGGCGACAICCKESTDRAETSEFAHNATRDKVSWLTTALMLAREHVAAIDVDDDHCHNCYAEEGEDHDNKCPLGVALDFLDTTIDAAVSRCR